MASDQVLREKLAERAGRFEELSRQLEDPAVAADAKRFPALLRERGVLEESARLHASWTELAQRSEEAEAILAEGESELAELAEVELGEARTSLVSLAEEARTALVADPEDERRRVIVEIRAGTGGDEATLFAADLFRMYGKLADARRWRCFVEGDVACSFACARISASDTDSSSPRSRLSPEPSASSRWRDTSAKPRDGCRAR